MTRFVFFNRATILFNAQFCKYQLQYLKLRYDSIIGKWFRLCKVEKMQEILKRKEDNNEDGYAAGLVAGRSWGRIQVCKTIWNKMTFHHFQPLELNVSNFINHSRLGSVEEERIENRRESYGFRHEPYRKTVFQNGGNDVFHMRQEGSNTKYSRPFNGDLKSIYTSSTNEKYFMNTK